MKREMLDREKETNPVVKEAADIDKAFNQVKGLIEKAIDEMPTGDKQQMKADAIAMLDRRRNKANTVKDFYEMAEETLEEYKISLTGADAITPARIIQMKYDYIKNILNDSLSKAKDDNTSHTSDEYGHTDESPERSSKEVKEHIENKEKDADDVVAGKAEPEEVHETSDGIDLSNNDTADGPKDNDSPAIINPSEKEFDNEKKKIIEENRIKDDAASVAESEMKKDRQSADGNGVPWLQPAIPEIDSNEARKMRNGEKADLRPFGEVYPEYRAIYDALVSRNVFEYVKKHLKKGDDVHFIIDPDFPTYTDKNGVVMPQILMAKRTSSGWQIVGLLSGQVSRYYGLDELRKDIFSEYNEFIADAANSGKTFVFSKHTRVRHKIPGFFPILSHMKKTGDQDIPITDMRGYSADSPVVLMTNAGLKVLNGKEINSSSINISNLKPGRIYYLSENEEGSYVPIMLSIAHFNSDEVKAGSRVFNAIRDVIVEMCSGKNVYNNDKLKQIKKRLNDLVYVNDVTFSFGRTNGEYTFRISSFRRDEKGNIVNDRNGKPVMDIKEWSVPITNEKIWMEKVDGKPNTKIVHRDILDDGLSQEFKETLVNNIMNHLLSMNRPLNIQYRGTGGESASTYNRLLEEGYITSNVTDCLTTVQANFFLECYDPKMHTFGIENKSDAAIRKEEKLNVNVSTFDPREVDDTEKQRRGDMLRNAQSIIVAENQIVETNELSARKAAEKWWDKNVPVPVTYQTEAGEVEISKKSVESSLAHRYSQAKLDAITSLKDGFKNAVYLGTMPDSRDTGTKDHYFAYPIDYGGKRCYVFCRVMQDVNKNRLYVHEVFVSDNIRKGNTLQTVASQPHGGISLYKDILANILEEQSSEDKVSKTSVISKQEWSRYVPKGKEGFEVSKMAESELGKKFSAKNATFAKGTVIFGHDVGGYTIEEVYQTLVKQGKLKHNDAKTKRPAKGALTHLDTVKAGKQGLIPDELWAKIQSGKSLTDQELEDMSYYVGYFPLWVTWANQNRELVYQLMDASEGKVLTDNFASTRVSQARALADVLDFYREMIEQVRGCNAADQTDRICRAFQSDPYCDKGQDRICGIRFHVSVIHVRQS